MAVAETRPRNRTTTTQLVLAVAYIRMSTDQQEDSPERQRAEIETMAREGGYEIIHWYEDHGKSGTKSKNRPQFQQLLTDAREGTFSAVLMHEQSRFSRETMLQFAGHLNKLNELGINLVTRKGRISPDDIGGFITAMIDQHGARAEAENIAHRGTSGKRQKLLTGGTWFGESPFGYDRMILDADGKELIRIRYGQKYTRSTSQGCRLVPSDAPGAVAAVRRVFQSTLDGLSMREVAIELNEAGFRTRFGNQFKISNIYQMLRNPTYRGSHVAGRFRSGQFSQVFEKPTVINEASHKPIVPPPVFDAVQQILKARKGGRFYGDKQNYLLSGIVVCGHCGSKVYGKTGSVLAEGRRSKKRKPKLYYQCHNGSQSVARGEKNCVSITGEQIEEVVINAIKTHVLTDDNLLRCEAAYRASLAEEDSPQSNRITDELRENIAKAQSNLALAEDAADFTAISQQLRQWRKELSQAVEAQEQPKVQSPFQGLGIEDLRSCRDFLASTDRGKLSDAIRQSVESVIITRVEPRTHKLTARILFHPEVYAGAEIVVPWEELHVRNGGRKRLPGFVATLDRPATIKDVVKEFSLSPATVKWYLGQCVSIDKTLVKADGGWVCSPCSND